MKCLACDVVLSDFEATRKFTESGTYVDLCNKCFFSGVADDVNFSDREDLLTNSDEDIFEELQ